MPPFYKLTEALEQLYESITVGEDGSIDEETRATLEAMQQPWREKAINIARLAKNLSGELAAYEQHEATIKARRMRIEKQVDQLKSYLRENMERLGETSVEEGTIKVRLCRNAQPTVVLQELGLHNVPAAFVIHPDPVLDKRKCLEHHKRGEQITGVEFLVGHHVRIS
jgi:hypothetical protein